MIIWRTNFKILYRTNLNLYLVKFCGYFKKAYLKYSEEQKILIGDINCFYISCVYVEEVIFNHKR